MKLGIITLLIQIILVVQLAILIKLVLVDVRLTKKEIKLYDQEVTDTREFDDVFKKQGG